MEPSTYLFVTAGLNALACGFCLTPWTHYTSEWHRRAELALAAFFGWNAYLHFLGAIG